LPVALGPPDKHAVHEKPATTFVAGLVGSPPMMQAGPPRGLERATRQRVEAAA